MVQRTKPGRTVLFGGSRRLAVREDGYVLTLSGDTWEHAGTPGAGAPLEVASVAFITNTPLAPGRHLEAVVTLSALAPAGGVSLSPHVHVGETTEGEPADPPGIVIGPVPLAVAAGEKAVGLILIAPGGAPLQPGTYTLAVAMERGGSVRGATFTVA